MSRNISLRKAMDEAIALGGWEPNDKLQARLTRIKRCVLKLEAELAAALAELAGARAALSEVKENERIYRYAFWRRIRNSVGKCRVEEEAEHYLSNARNAIAAEDAAGHCQPEPRQPARGPRNP